MSKLFWIPVLPLALAGADVTFERQPGRVDVKVDGAPFTSLHYADTWDKPFLHPLRMADGTVVTRRWPVEKNTGEVEDHDWHRGLWWTHGDVNGVDFWREKGRDKTGRLVVERPPRTKKATLTVECAFVAPDATRHGTVLQEFTFGGDGTTRWVDTTITVRADAGRDIRLGDTEEGSLGFRYADEFRENRGAALRNSEGGLGTKEIWGKPARWVDYAASRDGKPMAVTILDHPANPRHPTYWHARGYGLNAANPFGVRDFTKDKSRDGGHTIPKNGTLQFRYRVVIHAGADPEALWKQFASR